MHPATRPPITLLYRFVLLSVLFAIELVPITVSLDGQYLVGKGEFLTLMGLAGPWVLRCVVAFGALFATFSMLHYREPLQSVSDELIGIRTIHPGLLAAHFVTLALFGFLAKALYGTTSSLIVADSIAVACLSSGVGAIALAACSFIPFDSWTRIRRATGTLWIYALATAMATSLAGMFSQNLWKSATRWTFALVQLILKLFVSEVVTDVHSMSIGTRKFNVEIALTCSGLEGAALILGFCALWLCLLHKEFRFPQALVIIPASVGTLFFLNAVRISALILIGNAGAPNVAMRGFHSQAGWIAFNLVAIGLVLGARRVQWITNLPAAPAMPAAGEENPAAPYLAPFLLILAAGMASAATSNGFEWLYPLRFFAAGAALLIYRRKYKLQDWHFGWEAPLIGALVFALWLAGDWLTGNHPQNPIVRSPDPWISTAQNIWLTLRLMSAIVTVPVAEELAFRGYLIRRIIALDFEQLSPRTFTAVSLLISSLAFGALHGSRWIAGTIAGLLYAAVYLRRGRIGDSVVAHATTNGLLAASVLVTGQWNLS